MTAEVSESLIIVCNYVAAVLGIVLMQSKYRDYTLPERASISLLIVALALNATAHLLNVRMPTEAFLSAALLLRMLTAACWRWMRCGRCKVTILLWLIGAVVSVCGLSGCSLSMPVGEGGRYGTVGVTGWYRPPVDWQRGPTFFPDKP